MITGRSVRLSDHPYLVINLGLFSIILLVLIYSGLFSPEKDNYPIVCIHEKITGKPCPSCGLSHSFSLMVRGRISEAYDWNLYGPRIFFFFAAQLVMRILFSAFWLKNPGTRRELILYDIGGSILLFVVSFLPFLVSIIRSMDVLLQ